MKYEMVRYVFAGVCTTGVNIGVFSALRYGTGCRLQAANIISILVAIIFAFVVNKYFVFRQKGKEHIAKECICFMGMRGVSLFVEVWGMYLLAEEFHISEMGSKVVLQFVVIVVNFFLSKCYIFRKQEV